MLPDHAETRPYAGGKMLAAKDDGVGLITFNQPEKRNAISMEMWTGLGDILDEFSEDSSVSVVILTGAGNKAFVSGADISQFEKNRNSADAQAAYDRANSVGRNKLIGFKKPVIARVRGFCMGGGLAIAMATDLRIASADSQFGIPAARLSIAYAPDAVRRLIDLVGPAHARMILYTAKRIDAAEAERIGLINKMTSEEASLGESCDPATRRELFERAEDDAERLDRFIGNLLDMTQLESGKMTVKLGPIEVGEAVESALARA
ncbi:MAG: hypothetical protein QOH05_3984, partial [Acetobacteraceae bacterium]|nr:hypothetical protein [Acetobacteraceae bacterium]